MSDANQVQWKKAARTENDVNYKKTNRHKKQMQRRTLQKQNAAIDEKHCKDQKWQASEKKYKIESPLEKNQSAQDLQYYKSRLLSQMRQDKSR